MSETQAFICQNVKRLSSKGKVPILPLPVSILSVIISLYSKVVINQCITGHIKAKYRERKGAKLIFNSVSEATNRLLSSVK